ncbi:hypothetical protein [Curtobacterium sp. VKM Ac-2887]|uniref:hypothetical protein n=1 Tax=Curtobacterium sp. VKM Ac-2887 TaxID=2783819 RepID=UPI00188B9B1A|nr:hypothetical protein [Curtobacterium sp. VKM Ac-2887]MBF4587965.1 hypothetical protein [Curtobacterium sp. VKM Ac-2887]
MRQRWAAARRFSRPTIIVAAITFGVAALGSAFFRQPGLIAGLMSTIALLALLMLALATLTNWLARIALWWLLGASRWDRFRPSVRRQWRIATFDRALQDRAPDRALVRIIGIRQRARRGTKCVVEHPFGITQEAWFWWYAPRQGDVYLVRCSRGWGPHSGVLDLLYVGSETTGAGVIYRLPRSTWNSARRQQRAQAR